MSYFPPNGDSGSITPPDLAPPPTLHDPFAAGDTDIELELRRTREQLAQIGENIREAFFLATHDWRTAIYVSPAFEQIWGIDRETVYRDLQQILTVVHPEDRPEIEASMTRRACGEERRSIEMDHRIFWRDGTIRWLRSTVNPVANHRGEVFRIAGTTRDITEQKRTEQKLLESEHRFRTIFEQAAVGVALIDTLSGRFVRTNEKYCQIIGYTHHEMTQKTFMDISHPEDLAHDLENMRRLHAGDIREFVMEKRLIHRDGTDVWINLTVSGMWTAGEAPTYSIGVVQDVTRRKQAEKRLRETETQLAHVARLSTVGTMVASIAHEIDQPLHAIATFSEACQTAMRAGNREKTVKIEEWLQDIETAALQAGEIVRRLKRFGSRQEKSCTSFPLRNLFEDSVKLVRFEAEQNGISLNCQHAHANIALTADRIQIQQVLVNLLQNAMEAVRDQPPDNRWITLSAVAQRQTIDIRVADGGQGMAIDATQAFEPFVTSKPDGLGLGLAISRAIVEAHGGRLWPDLSAAAATVFRIELPCHQRCS